MLLASPRMPVSAAGLGTLPTFADFVRLVTDGQPDIVRGVYVPGVMAFPVLQQTAGDPAMVISQDGVITQFGAAATNHVIGLLAHNNLAGAVFSNLKIGQEIRIIYGDGRVEHFIVATISSFKANDPENPYSTFSDWKSDITYSAQDIFKMFYMGERHVTFQTCILKDGVPSWGRLFVMAVPVSDNYFLQTGPESLSLAQINYASFFTDFITKVFSYH
jgi:hypothetical protein